MIYGRFVRGKEDLDAANDIIRRVYEAGPGLAESEEGDGITLSALVFSGTSPAADGDPAGAGRLLFGDSGLRITDIAVLPEYRGRGYGDFLVRMLADRAVTSGAGEVIADAFAGTEGFFARIGFEPAGEALMRDGAIRQPMRLASVRLACGQRSKKRDGSNGRISL